jgi:hypothetical protein
VNKQGATFLALAGLAEAGIYYSILLWRVMAITSVALACWAVLRPSKRKVFGAIGLMAVVVAIVQPWTDFGVQSYTEDPDVGYWQERWRDLSSFLVGAAAVCSAFSILASRRLSKATSRGQSEALEQKRSKEDRS